MLEDIVKNHEQKVPIDNKSFENAEFLFNTPNHISVLSEYQLSGIKEVREHNYSNKHEYNLDGEIINEEDIIGCNGDFYLGWYTEIAYVQLYVPYRCDDFTIIRYRSADIDARQGEWNSDIKFIVHHNAEICREAERNVAFRSFLSKMAEIEHKWELIHIDPIILSQEEIDAIIDSDIDELLDCEVIEDEDYDEIIEQQWR